MNQRVGWSMNDPETHRRETERTRRISNARRKRPQERPKQKSHVHSLDIY